VQTQAVAVEDNTLTQQIAQVALVVQVTQQLLIGVNYGTTLCIS
jgi:hypothetical protein